jgi:hypothetical protein
VQVLVVLQPIGRIQQVDPPGHGAKQPRVGRGHAVDHQPQEEGQAGRWIGDVDRLPAPPAGPVAVLGGDRPVALADVLAHRRVKTPGQIMVVGGDRQQVGQGEPVVQGHRGAEGEAGVSGGVVRPPERPGHGILWSAEALERYRVR